MMTGAMLLGRYVRGWAGLACAAAAIVASARGEDFDANTRPSRQVTLAFVRPGRIAEMKVKEGQKVRAGQLLARLDDAVERAQLAQLEAAAGDTTRIRAAEAELKQKRVDLKRIEDAFRKNVATQFEVDRARLDVTISTLRLELAKFEHAQDVRKFREAQLQLERMRLVSPIDGRVEKVHVHAGEAVDALGPVVLIVRIDPLWVEAPLPVQRARRLRPGESVRVRWPGQDPGQPGVGKIIYIGSVADSGTLLVRAEVPNPTDQPAGLTVKVEFPPAGALAPARTEAQPATQEPEGAANVFQRQRPGK